MVDNTPSEKGEIYYGEPDKELLEEITENIKDGVSLQDSNAALCLRLKLSKVKSIENKIIMPNVCWEKICKTGDSKAHLPFNQNEINNLIKELIELKVSLGDFEQIIKMLKTKKAPAMKNKNDESSVFKASRFLNIYKRENNCCLMHSLTQRKIFGGAMLASLYELFANPIRVEDVVDVLSLTYPKNILYRAIKDLKNKGMIISKDDSDLGIYLYFFKLGMDQYNIQHMYFIPTNDCNLRCSYCFVEDDQKCIFPIHMTEDIARKGLEIFAKLTERASQISLTFYGGEPLLNPEIVYFSMNYVRTLEKQGAFKRPVEMSLLTNGTLVDDRTIEAVLETNTLVSVSIDGPEDLNGARKSANAGDTFHKSLAGFRKLQNAGVSLGISCTLNQFNVGHVEEITKFIYHDLKAEGMGFNVLVPRTDGSNPVDIPYEDATRQIIESFEILREKGIYEDRMMRRIKPYKSNGFNFKDCMGVGGQIVLAPDGKIGPCQGFLGFNEYFPLSVEILHSQLATLTSEDIYKNSIFDELRHRFPLNMRDCIDCSAIAICGGGCPYASFVRKNSIWEIDDRVCSQSKEIMKWMLWDTYDRLAKKGNGVL